MRISFYLTVMMLASPLICRAGADSGYFFSSVNYQSGLSHSAVLSIFQDRDGLMWFGTYDGVNCYDGRSVSVFKSDFSKTMTLSNNIIHNIIQAPGDNLWLNTHLGLDLFSRSTQKVSEVYRFNCDYSILSDSAGDTWVVSADSLWYYNNFHREFVRADVKFHGKNPGLRSFVSESGALWHCPENSGRMDIYTVSSFDADSASVHINVSRYDLHDLPVKQMFYQSGDICFIDSRDDLYIYNIWNKSKIFIRNIGSLLSSYGEISGLTLFYDDIVLGFKTSGLFRLVNSGTEPLEELDRNLRIYGLYRDEKQGILWVATDGAGAVYYAKKKPVAANNLMLRRLSRDLTRPVRSIMTDMSGNLWFGTKGDGLVRVAGDCFPSGGGRYRNPSAGGGHFSYLENDVFGETLVITSYSDSEITCKYENGETEYAMTAVTAADIGAMDSEKWAVRTLLTGAYGWKFNYQDMDFYFCFYEDGSVWCNSLLPQAASNTTYSFSGTTAAPVITISGGGHLAYLSEEFYEDTFEVTASESGRISLKGATTGYEFELTSVEQSEIESIEEEKGVIFQVIEANMMNGVILASDGTFLAHYAIDRNIGMSIRFDILADRVLSHETVGIVIDDDANVTFDEPVRTWGMHVMQSGMNSSQISVSGTSSRFQTGTTGRLFSVRQTATIRNGIPGSTDALT